MNKSQLIDQIATSTGFTKANSEIALNAVLAGIETGLTNDGNVRLLGFGGLEVKETPARKGRNPKTGEPIEIKASKKITFKASDNLKAKM
jgi:DNA-binding protein HU-beta